MRAEATTELKEGGKRGRKNACGAKGIRNQRRGDGRRRVDQVKKAGQFQEVKMVGWIGTGARWT